ncbi:transcriptional regulator [Kytococcus sedentarius]|uniref:transcriptional regulator n=1 Tax=Kytococcus sedentarius TaxID=1276 RepID=UPI0035BBC2D5
MENTSRAPSAHEAQAALAMVETAKFAAIRDAVEISDSTLSKQASALEQAHEARLAGDEFRLVHEGHAASVGGRIAGTRPRRRTGIVAGGS